MKDPHRDADIEEANSRLLAGLKSCRTLVESYRMMLSGDDDDDVVAGGEPEAGDPLTA